MTGSATEAQSDAALVARARGGDGAALAVLFARHRDSLAALCRRLISDASLAEDSAQDAALTALLALHRLRSPELFGPWLRGIGVRTCRRALRARAVEQRHAGAGPSNDLLRELPSPDDLPEPGEALSLADASRAVRDAVADLPAGQRAAVRLFYLQDLSYEEAAAVLALPLGALKVRLHKARAALRERLDPALDLPAAAPLAGIPAHVRAVHGAGHALVHLLNGGIVSRISVAATEVDAPRAPGAQRADAAASTQLGGYPAFELLTATMAGEAAELQAHRRRRYPAGLGDRPTAKRIARSLTGGDPVETALVVDQARRAAQERLASPRVWPVVERVRAALLTHQSLDGDDLRRLVSR